MACHRKVGVKHNTRTRRGKPPTHHKGLMVAITFAEARAIAGTVKPRLGHLASTELSSSAMEDERHFLVVRGA